ncbi:hypothetical protein EDD16DRAFT_1537873 [Pisolithus croceorrhizus]|nr:hypothetical protein EDD16DRAFT_1537873 [Pisolithus croceorrhizus]KAI6134549.1 hypothetical protein EV401DRAFT_1905826 [Pisolithus croceorrhizus]
MGKAYVVTVGTEPGVYDTWIEASWKIRGVQYPVYQGFTTREEAERVFRAALARGEVISVSPIASESGKKPTSTKVAVKQEKSPPSPVSSEVSLLRTPSTDAKGADSLLARRGAIPSPPPSPVGRLHRALRENSLTFPTPPSPFTEVTQHESVDKDLRPAHVTWVSPGTEFDYSLAHSDSIEESPFALMGNQSGRRSPSKDWRPPVSSETEECEPGKYSPQSRVQVPARGVAYRTLDELVTAENIDPRIWLPAPVPREFDPAKVKRRPLTRPPSPVKPASSNSTSSSFETPQECSMAKPHTSNTESANVRTSRGRPSRLTPSLSLPVLPPCEIDLPLLNIGGSTKTRACEQPAADDLYTERLPECNDSPRNSSHIQLVQHEDGNQAGAFRIHCPPGCLHESCNSPSVLVVPIEEVAKSKYVDAAVSPIIQETRITCDAIQNHHASQGPPKAASPVSRKSHARGFPSGVDVRSPMVRGIQLPFTSTLTFLGRPTPPTQSPRPRSIVWE